MILPVVLLTAVGGEPAMAQSTDRDIASATRQLFNAVEDNNLAGVQVSIAEGGDTNAVNEWGLTPVDLAVDKGHFNIVHYLLSVRELHKSGDAAPAPAPAPALSSAPVSRVYTPPPGSDPWSATVVTAAPTAGSPAESGPSPFDAAKAAPKSLPIIGEVRGPDNPVVMETPGVVVETELPKETVEIARTTVPVASKAKPAPGKEGAGFIESLMRKYLGREPEKHSPPEEAEETTPPENVKHAVINAPTPPVSPPGVTGTPPPIKGKLMPDAVVNAPLSSLPEDELHTPQVVPVGNAPGREDMAMLEAEPDPEDLPTPRPIKRMRPKLPPPTAGKALRGPTRQAGAKPIGRTPPPGKPRDETGWFEQFKTFLSFGGDDNEKDDGTGTRKIETGDTGGGDWRVKEIEQAQVVPRPPVKKNEAIIPKRRLDGVILTLGMTTSLGKVPPPQAPAPWFHKSCINKKLGSIIFCIEPLDWPDGIKTSFLTDSVMYEGTQTIVRYDEGSATYFHTLFPSSSYADIVEFFRRRYGEPTQVLNRSIAPLALPRMANPTVIWKSRAPVTNLLTTLEIRLYDDARGGFPDTKRGAVYLYHEWSQPVFPQLSSVELMLLRADAKTR